MTSMIGDEMTFISPPSTVSRLLSRDVALPNNIDGLKIVASDRRLGYEQYAFGSSFSTPQSRSAFYGDGGIILSISKPLNDLALSQSYAEDLATGRITLTQVGDHEALVSHASPDDRGLREHRVGWIEDGFEFNLSAVRSADELVDMARSIVC